MKKTVAKLLLILMSIVLALAIAADAKAQDSTQLATFDTVWAVINRLHFDSTFGGVNWNAVRTELRPRAARAKTAAELRTVLSEMVRKLGQSHYAIIPQQMADKENDSSWQGDVGFEVRYIDRAVVVAEVDPTGPAASAGIKRGWELKQIGDQPIAKVLERADRAQQKYSYPARAAMVAREALAGPEDSKVQLRFLDAGNKNVTVGVKRRRDPGVPVRLGQLPTMFTRFDSRAIQQGDLNVGLLWFNVWMVPVMARFDSAVDRMRSGAGIIVDLRGNPGGAGAMSMGVAGHFVDSARVFGTMNTRTSKLVFRANPRRTNAAGERVAPFSGPVAVLMDELSGSTSEVFAGGLQSIGRVRVFGSKSMGAVLPAQTRKLPNGDVLYHAIADFLTADGTLLEGRGVIPDEQVTVKRADLLAGRDPVLEAALHWIAVEARARKTGSGEPSFNSEKKQ